MTTLFSTKTNLDRSKIADSLYPHIEALGKDQIYVASFHDVHLGHHRTTAREIISGLMKALPDNEETAKLDLILFAGDLFDRLLHLPDDSVGEIHVYFIWLLGLCKKHNIVLRALEGTPSHDWKQSKLLVDINAAYNIGADVRHVTDMEVEIIDSLGLSVLYVPDEWDPNPSRTLKEAKNCINKATGDIRCDLIVMHGGFEFQLPGHMHPHNSEDWSALARTAVFCGHIHQAAIKDNIIVSGSFDRICHGDEMPKGHYRLRIKPHGIHDVFFVENKAAKTFLDLDVSGLPPENAIKYLSKKVENYRKGSYLRIVGNMGDDLPLTKSKMVELFPSMVWSFKPLDKKRPDIIGDVVEDVKQGIDITSDNIAKLVSDRMTEKGIASEKALLALELLNRVA